MKRVQDALTLQLSTHSSKLNMEIHEKEQSVKKMVKKREDIGVELYSVQQQLARLQALLEGTESSSAVMTGYRQEAERKKRLLQDEYETISANLDTNQKNLEVHKSNVERMNTTLKQVKLYSSDLDSKIMVAKRTTLKAEADIIKREMEKRTQDYYIDNLTNQLRRLQEQRALFETQYVAQQGETRAAMETLHEASVEMEAVQYEKRQLLHQWKSSLIGVERRDVVLDSIKKEIE
jgi:chromosome segregation ATPase